MQQVCINSKKLVSDCSSVRLKCFAMDFKDILSEEMVTRCLIAECNYIVMFST